MKTLDTQLISSILAEKLVVKDIFSDDYLFTIPNYQRPYSWEEEHCTQLLDDLHSFAFKSDDFNDSPPYFLGSAVIIKRQNIRNAQIVDGQQRLTTLTILLSCLRYSIEDKKNKATISSLIFQNGDELLGTSATYRLKTRTRDQHFFNTLIQDEKGIIDYYKNTEGISTDNDAQKQMLLNAKALVEEFARKNYSQDQLKLLAKYIIQKCVIVVVASTDEEMAFRIFNVLNDRGKDLTISDILKSEILEKVGEKEQNDYTDKWEDCEANLGIDSFKDFFSHLRAIYAKKKAERSILSEVREYVNPTKNSKSFIDDTLIPFTKAYNNILKSDYKSTQYADIINEQFKKIKRVQHTDWIPPSILFLAKHPNAPEKVKDFLIQLEKLTLGMEGMKTSLNDRLERYAKVISRIESGGLYLADSEFLLIEKDRQNIVASLNNDDLYGKRLVKPVLAKIEEQMNDGSITVNYGELSIEHILPQTPNAEYWTSRFKSNDRIKLTDCIGNLSLITVRKNSQAKNYEYSTKIKVYFKADGKASNLAMVNNLTEFDDWTSDIIKSRKTELINHFLDALGLDKIIIEKDKKE